MRDDAPSDASAMELEYVNRWVDMDVTGYDDLVAAVRAGPLIVG